MLTCNIALCVCVYVWGGGGSIASRLQKALGGNVTGIKRMNEEARGAGGGMAAGGSGGGSRLASLPAIHPKARLAPL